MGDFATELIYFQPNSISYSAFGLNARKITSFESSMSTCDSSSDQWSTPKTLSPDDSMTSNGPGYKWCEVPLDRRHLFQDKGSDSETNGESEYKFYTPRRVSSLKTNRTPPGTPKSKAVRFADMLGLDLEDVRHVFNLDLPPKIPASARQDLVLDTADESTSLSPPLRLVAQFVQPGVASDFLRRVRMHNVSLENSHIVGENVLTGTVRVINITFDKRVSVRVSFNEWISYVDLDAAYVQDSHDGVTDRFSFSVLLPPSCLTYSHRVQLAVCYECSNGARYWDNNFGHNYIYSCVSESLSPPNYL